MIFRLERCGMKFGHIGDLHIGKRVHDFSMLEDQRYILDQMMKIFEEQKVDGVLIAGDVMTRQCRRQRQCSCLMNLLQDWLKLRSRCT